MTLPQEAQAAGAESPTKSGSRIGVIVPSTNTMVETDFWRNVGGGTSVHASRMYLEETTAEDERRMVTEYLPAAQRDLATCRPDVVVFACTSAGAVLGVEAEAELITELSRVTGAPVVSTNDAVAQTLREAGIERPAVVTAYIPDLTERIVHTLSQRGFDVTQAYSMGVIDPFAIAEITAEEIIEFTKKHVDTATADGIFISCTNLRAYEAIDRIEEWAGLPVITSNQAALKQALKAIEK